MNVNNDYLMHLIKMANQISINAPAKSHGEAVQFVAHHLEKFWARDMKRQIKDYAISDGEGLSSVSLEAVNKLSFTKY